ncbi:MAG: hypothetical protein ACRD9L_12160, partial [Bryobacteraceae bacterium]
MARGMCFTRPRAAPARKALACGLLAAALLGAQVRTVSSVSKDNPPVQAQSESLADPALWPQLLQLSRIKRRMAGNLQHEPDYTCVETIERSQRLKPSRRFELLDVLRLEVALVSGTEMFAWPGAGKFEYGDPRKFIGSGAIGNGYFALHARAVFLSSAPLFTYGGEEQLAGRRAVRYDYRIALLSSGYHLKSAGKDVAVAYHGSFWADAETLDVLRLTVDADDIPVALNLARADTLIDYQRMKIGESGFLLPVVSDLVLTDFAGNDNRNRMRFTSCRQYTGGSVLSFADPPPDTPQPAAASGPREIRLPRGLWIETTLERKIDSRRAAVGDHVDAIVSRSIKRHGHVVIPKGARLAGRLTRLQ